MNNLTTLQKLIKEFEHIKYNKCKTLQEVIFFDGVLAIIESEYLKLESEEIINSFLAGKEFANGKTFAPKRSRELAEEWFNEKYNRIL